MSFFNKKEEVINIELTPYGKGLLAKGKFKPMYYEFYDDDIIYDSRYTSLEEKQGEIQQRIKETPSIKPQYSFDSADKRLKEARERLARTRNQYVPILEKRKNFTLGFLPLGNTSIGNEEATAIQIKLLNGSIDGTFINNEENKPKNITTIKVQDINHIINVRKKEENEKNEVQIELYDTEPDEDNDASQEVVFSDGILKITKETGYLLLDMDEIGAENKNDRFEIFLYEMDEIEKIEKQLFFIKERNNIKDGLLYDTYEIKSMDREITEEFVEYYFEILTDKEIPSEVLCGHLSKEQIEILRQKEGFEIDCTTPELMQARTISSELFVSEEEIDNLEEC